jgi:hypothetical protein
MRAGIALGPTGAKRYYLFCPPGKIPARKMALNFPERFTAVVMHSGVGPGLAQPYSDPAGPDASRMVLACAQRAFAQRDSVAAAAGPRA